MTYAPQFTITELRDDDKLHMYIYRGTRHSKMMVRSAAQTNEEVL